MYINRPSWTASKQLIILLEKQLGVNKDHACVLARENIRELSS